MTRIVVMDTETTGIQPDAHVWDFAAIVRDPGEPDREVQFFVKHDYSRAAALPEPFLSDYRARYDPSTALDIAEAVGEVHALTAGAHIVGAVPNFDTERLALPMRAHGVEPAWHYHLIDIETLAIGYLANSGGQFTSWHSLAPPWDSDVISRAIGVEPPAQGEGRHTALGDVRWARDVLDAVISAYDRFETSGASRR